MYKVAFGLAPSYVHSIFDQFKDTNRRTTRTFRPFRIPADIAAKTRKSPVFQLMDTWNNVEPEIRNIQTLSEFKSKTSFSKSKIKIISTIMIKNLNRKEEICLNRLRVDLLLPAHLYNHNFPRINPNCIHCNVKCSTKHFLVNCQQPAHRQNLENLFTELDGIAPGLTALFMSKTIPNKCNFLLFGDETLDQKTNFEILKKSSKFIVCNL